uniref:HMG box domain containing 3 n=1 Tax=Kryptolebias marmoratus TaxID=37003 RepID=A0A3Q2ZPJ3_KRYMA
MDKEEVLEVAKVSEEVDYTEVDVTTPKKRRNKAQEDNVERPKKPRSAFLLYYFDVHHIMQLGSRNMPQSVVNKKISESWKSLSVSEKSCYLERAKLEREGKDTSSFSPSKQLPGFRKILPRANCFLLPKGNSSSHQPEGSVDVTVNGGTLKRNEAKPAKSCYNGTVVPQTQGEATQVVTIVPSQSFLEPQSAAGVGSLRPMMMISLGVKSETAKPAYKMSLKTYTKRGRGRCLNPGCSFVYVTRHKPSTCPDCGSHLGGKWSPSAKKTQGKEAASKQLPQEADAERTESHQTTTSPAQETDADVSKANTSRSKKEGRGQLCVKKQRAAGMPLEGSSVTPQQTKQVKDKPKGAVIHSQSRSTSAAIVQKRPVRPILPALHNTGGAFLHIIAVPPDKEKLQEVNNVRSSAVTRGSFSGLKPSTLKQLGQMVPTARDIQDSPSQPVSSVADGGVNVVSVMSFKQQTASSFDLGLSTGRGRGRCKNPSCDYVYKNRHKPAVCPKCGNELTQKNTKATKSETLLDPHQDLSPAQRDIQRQSTIQLLRTSLQIPESEAELQETLTLIQELNGLRIIFVQTSEQEQAEGAETETLVESGWPRCYESAATHCGLCNYPLFKGEQSSVAGQEDCWLLTETLMQTATLQLKVCLNVQCLALNSFTELHPGLFNIGNRLLVSIDLFLKIRANIKLGQPPSQAAGSVFDHNPSHPVHTLSPEESSQIQELLLTGYWAFECLTVRDYNDMICGICGVAPKLEIAQRYTNNVLELKHVEFTWPECSVSDEVHVDDFWLTMESEAIEQAVFPAEIPITRVDASIIAPFAPPLMRSPTVINTEKDKVLPHIQQPAGDPSVLVRLIHDNQLTLEKTEELNEEELRTILDRCGVNDTQGSSKDELLASLVSLYTHVRGGLSTTPQPPAHLTAGKLSKVCPHQVVCSSKYLIRGETARDHVDLLLSSRYWPPVYVCDCPQQVALCTDLQYPELATQMWGRNQGCFSDPFEKPELVSCPELKDVPYSADLSSVADNQQALHPITKSHSRWLVCPPGASPEPPASEHHSMIGCKDLEPYVSLVAELTAKKEEEDQKHGQQTEPTETPESDSEEKDRCLSVRHTREQPVTFSNAAYYYLYNRLVDFLTSRDIVNQQISYVVKACQPGEVAIRDALYRLGVAQINTE